METLTEIHVMAVPHVEREPMWDGNFKYQGYVFQLSR